MIIYLDLLFILNVWIDLLLIITCNIILKYDTSYTKIIFGALIGGISTFCVFISNDFILIFLKIIISFIIQIVVNGFKGLKTTIENVIYYYFVNIILAGTLYMFRIDQLNLFQSYLSLFILTPLILMIYNKKIKKLNLYYKERYNVQIKYKNKNYNLNAYVDTGNKLYDQFKKRPISILYNKKIENNCDNFFFVPIQTANSISTIKCIKVDQMIIEGKIIKNPIIGFSKQKINIQDIDMILHKDIL